MANLTITVAGRVLTAAGIIDTAANNGGSHMNDINTDLQVLAALSTFANDENGVGNAAQIVTGSVALLAAIAQTWNDVNNNSSTTYANYFADVAYITGDLAIIVGGVAGLADKAGIPRADEFSKDAERVGQVATAVGIAADIYDAFSRPGPNNPFSNPISIQVGSDTSGTYAYATANQSAIGNNGGNANPFSLGGAVDQSANAASAYNYGMGGYNPFLGGYPTSIPLRMRKLDHGR